MIQLMVHVLHATLDIGEKDALNNAVHIVLRFAII